MKQTGVITIIVVLLLCGFVLPAGAVMLEVTVKGPVATINPDKNTLTVDYPLQYECNYPVNEAPVCSYTPTNKTGLTGTVPDALHSPSLKTAIQLSRPTLGVKERRGLRWQSYMAHGQTRSW